ncbi:MAG: hypothetical protein ACOCP8_03905 [archaeon]
MLEVIILIGAVLSFLIISTSAMRENKTKSSKKLEEMLNRGTEKDINKLESLGLVKYKMNSNGKGILKLTEKGNEIIG